MPTLKSILPLRIKPLASAFALRDVHGRTIAHVYYRDDPGTARQAELPTKPEAEELAKAIARALTAHLEAL